MTRATTRRGGDRYATARARVALVVAFAVATAPGAALAGPKGGKATKGRATITQSGDHTQIETYQKKTIIDWRSFDVGVGESVTIAQPSHKSRTLNRVSDASVTQIDGSVTSNGQVWVVNPAGVYFGGQAQIEVQKLVAAAGDVTDAHFKKGKQRFTDLAGEVRNDGSILARDVTLAGARVSNRGQIVARDGDLVMAAGDDVFVTKHDTYILVRADGAASAGDPTAPSIENTGTLDAGRGRAQLAAGDFLGLAIQNRGGVRAHEIELTAGAESLVDVSGTLDASNDAFGREGGTIDVEGDWVNVAAATLDASGDAGGGAIRVGGERHAKRKAYRRGRAKGAFVDDASVLSADAISSGDGGEVVVVADEIAAVHGTISARGGDAGGDGGFVETSAKTIDVTADVSVGASAAPDAAGGAPGTWLIDPVDVDIVLASQIPVAPSDPFIELFEIDDGNLVLFAPGGEPQIIPPSQFQTSYVAVESLETALARGGNVFVTTETLDPQQPGTAPGDIDLLAPLSIPVYDPLLDEPKIAPGTFSILTLRAANDINLANTIFVEEGADLTLGLVLRANDNAEMAIFTDGDSQIESVEDKRTGTVFIQQTVQTNGGFVDMSGANVDITGDVRTQGGDVSVRVVDLARFFEEIDEDAEGLDGDFGHVTVSSTIDTDGGEFRSACHPTLFVCGEDFTLGPTAQIDVREPTADDDAVASILIEHFGTVAVEGALRGEQIRVAAGIDGTGDLVLGRAGVPASLEAATIALDAGNGADPDDAKDDSNAMSRIVVADVGIQALDDMGAPVAPDTFFFSQDAALAATDLPTSAMFTAGTDGMTWLVEVRDGAPDAEPPAPDLTVGVAGDPTQFTGTDLVLIAPRLIELPAPITPETVEMILDDDFTVTTALATNLQPARGMRIRAGTDGTGDLLFDPGVTLVADEIGLRAGSGLGAASLVAIAGDTMLSAPGGGTPTSISVVQDASITEAHIPLAAQIPGGPAGVELTFVSEGGSVTLSDPSRVAGSDLTLTGRVGGTDPDTDEDLPIVDIQSPITVERMDVGGLSSFEVTQELLDAITIAPPNPLSPKILTLRGTGGLLSFATVVDADGVFVSPVSVTADYIELVGAAIDVRSNEPVFQTIDPLLGPVSPKRLIFDQAALIDDSVTPTEANYPDGLGPSEYMVFRSPGSASALQILLDQTNTDNVVQNPPPGARGWGFPVQPNTKVALAAPAVGVTRTDGFDVELGAKDRIYGDDVQLTAILGPDASGDPLGNAQVDALDLGLLRSFDSTLDFTTPLPTVVDEDGVRRLAKEDAVDGLAVQQEATFLRGAGSLLPNLAFQPTSYALATTLGHIEVDNAKLADTNLTLQVLTPVDQIAADAKIDFDPAGPLAVESLDVLVNGDLVVDPDADVVAQESIELGISTPVCSENATSCPTESLLSFGAGPGGEVARLEAPDVRLSAAFDTEGRIDAETNAPRFVDVETFEISQGARILNGFVPPPGVTDFGRIPDASQFVYTSGGMLEQYTIESTAGGVEINDPSALLFAESVNVRAGTASQPLAIVLRADVPSEPNLVLIPAGGPIRGLNLNGGTILLEAPYGYVDAGDPRASFTLSDPNGLFAIRQRDPIAPATAGQIASVTQMNDVRGVTFVVQSMTGDPVTNTAIEVGTEFADRIERTNLVLKASMLPEEFELAFGGVREGDPDPNFPDAVYDRFADFDGNGVIGAADRAAFDALVPVSIQIGDPAATVDLTLQSLTIESEPDDGAPIRVGAANIVTEDDQVYQDQVELLGGTSSFRAIAGLFSVLDPTETAPASNLTFEREIDADPAAVTSVVMVATASDLITFGGDVGATHRLDQLTLNLQQIASFTTQAPEAAVSFGGQGGAADFAVHADLIELNKDSGTSTSEFFNPDPILTPTFFHDGGDLLFDAGPDGQFVMGEGQKLSTNGSTLTINTSGPLDASGAPVAGPSGTATVGDLSAVDLIRIASADLHLQRRPGGDVLRANGRVVRDRGLDIVANDVDFHFDYDATTDPTGGSTLRGAQLGKGANTRFGLGPSTPAPSYLSAFEVYDLQYNLLENASMAPTVRSVLDGVPDGISRVDISQVFWTPAPAAAIAVPAAYRVSDPQTLRSVGVLAEPPTPREVRSLARGAAVYDDLRSTAAPKGLVRVSEDRLVAREIEKASRLHARIFGPDGAHAPVVREALQSAVDDYRRSTGTRRVVGFELRRYIYNRPSSQFEAYQALQSLDSLFRHHRRSGLTPAEYADIQREWLELVKPEGITLEQFAETVNPSRYVRGSDVLDIFGD